MHKKTNLWRHLQCSQGSQCSKGNDVIVHTFSTQSMINKLLPWKTMKLHVWYCAEILPKVRLQDHYNMYEPCPSHPLEFQRFNRPLPGNQFENFQSTSSWHDTNNKRKLESLTKEESLLLNLAYTLLHPK